MNKLTSRGRYEEPVAAWYFAALLTLAGCEDVTPLPSRCTAEALRQEPQGERGHAAPPRCRLAETALVRHSELTGTDRKTWNVISAEWDGKLAQPPFESITFFADGTWRDSSGVGGAWRLNPENRRLCFELIDFEMLIGAEVLQLSDDEVVIEFASYAPGMVLILGRSACGGASE